MDKRTKAYKIHQEAIQKLGHTPETIEDLGKLMAIMLVAVTSPGSSPKSRHDPAAVEFVDTLIEYAGDAVISDPFDASWYKQAEWRLRDCPMTLEDAKTIGQYLADGGWVGNTPTVGKIIRWLPDLLQKAQTSGGYDPRFSV